MADRFDVDRVEFFQGQDGLWYFRRVAANNETVAQSEGYQHRGDAKSEAEALFGDARWFEPGADEGWVELDRSAS